MRRQKDIFYIHNTPLAGLAAHLHADADRCGKAVILEKLPFLDLPEHLERAGTDTRGCTVYGLWTREADPLLIRRLLEGFLRLEGRAADSYEIRMVLRQRRLTLIAFLFKCGFYRAARRLLVRHGELSLGHLVPGPGID